MRPWARRTRRRAATATTLLGVVGLLGLSACSSSRAESGGDPASAATTTLAPTDPSTPATPGSTPAAGPAATTTAVSAAPTTVAAAPTTVAVTTTTERPTITRSDWRALDDQLAIRLMSGGSFAASWAVSIDGEVVHTGAVGQRVPTPRQPAQTTATSTTAATTTTSGPPTTVAGTGDPVAPTDKFRIASISKVITATVVLQLVEDGDIDLDAPVAPQLARWLGVTIADPAVATITPRQLLTHTSGFGVYQSTFFSAGVRTCREAAARGLASGVETPPGTDYRYSNMNYCLLGLLIEQVTGEPYEAVVQARLLDPLGIEGMRLAGTFDPRSGEAQHPSIPNRNYMETLGAAGAWVASAADVVTILDSLDPSMPGWHPLPDIVLASMRLASRGIVYDNIAERWYGLGLIVWADGSYGHTGTIENTHAMVIDRPDGVTWSILVNGEYPSETNRLRDIFDDAVADAGLPL